jgi:integrase/recombinase XerD
MEINVVLLKGFKKWLSSLGYADSTIYCSTKYVSDFFGWLKKNGLQELEQINSQTVEQYHFFLQTRKNKRLPGSLSSNYIIGNINALKRLGRYLQVTGKTPIEIGVRPLPDQSLRKTILTKQEIQALYQICDNNPLGIRDRIMLDIYYGCGLRRSEGVEMDIRDVMLKERMVYVRSGKGYRQRYVPITEGAKERMEDYIKVTRKVLLRGRKEKALLISYRGKRITGNATLVRLRRLVISAGIDKRVDLHTLRHSIATHLLQSGMKMEDVSRFLGHQSLETTQIYTHLANE